MEIYWQEKDQLTRKTNKESKFKPEPPNKKGKIELRRFCENLLLYRK